MDQNMVTNFFLHPWFLAMALCPGQGYPREIRTVPLSYPGSAKELRGDLSRGAGTTRCADKTPGPLKGNP